MMSSQIFQTVVMGLGAAMLSATNQSFPPVFTDMIARMLGY